MLNIEEINNTIEKLENEETTYSNCSKLANLYIVRDHIKTNSDIVVKEYRDILPSYNSYVEVKQKYQLNKATLNDVETNLKALCREILEFLDILYSSCENVQGQALILAITDEFKKAH